ncbi:MAG: methyltransferase domain-containing protein [Candidatus Ancaeobacter aquaticus]|nr:methyltransferase domain-containing protein [Candidatus Ancaeobacter aquaticus]
MKIIDWLKLPEVNKIDCLDERETTLLYAQVIKKKHFLNLLYRDFYRNLVETVKDSSGKSVIELGSGGGFVKEVFPQIITSDIIHVPGLDLQFSVERIPFKKDSVDVYIMIDVLHHIDNVEMCLDELCRSLKIGGKIVMIEPANTIWSRFIYSKFHQENFDIKANWHSASSNPLFSANGALPWIIFVRDRKIYEEKYSALRIQKIKTHTPIRYLISGGVTMRQLLPSCTYNCIRYFEKLMAPLNKYIGMFLTIEIRKIK